METNKNVNIRQYASIRNAAAVRKHDDHLCSSVQLRLSAVLREAAGHLRALLLEEEGADPHPWAEVWRRLRPSS